MVAARPEWMTPMSSPGFGRTKRPTFWVTAMLADLRAAVMGDRDQSRQPAHHGLGVLSATQLAPFLEGNERDALHPLIAWETGERSSTSCSCRRRRTMVPPPSSAG